MKRADWYASGVEGAVEYAIDELEGVLHDLRGQFDPNDGGVCARTVARVIKCLVDRGIPTIRRKGESDA